MDALTLTPAWGGGGVEAHDGGGGGDGDSSKGKGGTEKSGGLGGGGGVSTASCGGGGRMAYWEKARKRRTMSTQLVFPVQPPDNTENIDQPDPSLCGELMPCSVRLFLLPPSLSRSGSLWEICSRVVWAPRYCCGTLESEGAPRIAWKLRGLHCLNFWNGRVG